MNIPMPAGATGEHFLRAFDQVVAPRVAAFAPTWLIISAGFDGHRDDPITDLGLVVGRLRGTDPAGDRIGPPGRRLVMLEGGYDLDALTLCTAAALGALEGVGSRAGGSRRVAGPAPSTSTRASTSGRIGSDQSSSLTMVPERFAPVLAELQPLTDRFRAAGKRLFLVGGTVRDLLISNRVADTSDFDATTDARPAEIKRCLEGWADAIWTQGEQFGTIGAKQGRPGLRDHDPSRRGVHRRLAQARRRASPTRSRPTCPGATSRSNAMALELTTDSRRRSSIRSAERPTSPRGTLRTPLSPEISFSDDPLRMLRAARFIAGHQLQPVPELVEAVRAMHERLSIVSAERIRDELDKLIVVDHPAAGLYFLRRHRPRRRVPAGAVRACAWSRIRSTVTRTC